MVGCKRVYQKFYFKHQVFLETDLRANFLANLISCLKDFIGSFGYVLSLIIGIILVQKGTLPLSYLITYVFLTNFFLNPIRSLFDLDFEFKESLNALRRILELTIDKKELKEKFVGDICFEKVSYSFNNINYVLKDIDLVIKAGNKVLITGSSGSGKSTLLKMIKGYYKSNVRIGDKVVTNPLNVVLISSSDLLFTDTIYNNLTLNNSKDINKIIDICCIDEIIKRFDLGYNTLLEENGFNLSAGQRQRIILGRSLSNADILLIDEATNSLNSNLERRILKKLFLYYKNKTIIVVSHRLDNLDLFDQYIKLSKGKVTLNETYNMGVKNV